MKEQDYMNIMGTIRGEFIEEAVSWDGAERRRIRQIRRMTASFGAVAAAVAVVVGVVAYKERLKKPTIATSDTESSMTEDLEQTENIFGGQGEIRVYPGNDVFADFYKDDTSWYYKGQKWSAAGGGRSVSAEKPENFYSDGKQMYSIHDDKIFELDSFGEETLLVDASEWQDLRPNDGPITRICREGDTLVYTVENGSQYGQSVAVNLKTGEAQEFPFGMYTYLAGGGEDGIYGCNYDTGTFQHFDADGNMTGDEPVFEMPEDKKLYSAVIVDGRIYAVYQKLDKDSMSYSEEKYLVFFDTKTNLLSGERTFADGSIVQTKNACYRILLADGTFSVFRATLDARDEKLVYTVPADLLWDADVNPNPATVELTEDGDTLVLMLPLYTYEYTDSVTKHGEDGVMIDMNTGKVLYFGRNYSLADASERSTESAATTFVSGTTAAGTTGSGITTTAQSGTTTAAVTTTAAQTTAQFKVPEGAANVFGGSTMEPIFLGRGFWMDGGEYYELGQSGSRFAEDQNGNLNRTGTICRKDGCRHNDDSCPLFHYNIEDRRSNPNSADYDGQNVHLVNGSYVQRGTKIYRLDTRTGDETLLFSITEIDGMTLGDNDFVVNNMFGVNETQYLVNCSVGTDVAGVNPDVTYLLNVDLVSRAQRLIAKPGTEGLDSDLIRWADPKMDPSDANAIYVLQNRNTLIRMDCSTGARTNYTLPIADDAPVMWNAWTVYKRAMWFMNSKGQWCSYDLGSGAFSVVRENTQIRRAADDYASCISLGNGMFCAVKDAADGGSRTLIFFRYDWKNSKEETVSSGSPINDLTAGCMLHSNYMGIYSAQDGFGTFFVPAESWDPLYEP